MLKVLYLVPNIADPAVARRVSMLRRGGAEIMLAGFRRAGAVPPALDVTDTIELGETFDADFAQRVRAVFGAQRRIRGRFRSAGEPDVILARNLEMLALGDSLVGLWGRRPAIGYECLDIHRLMLRGDLVGRTMRAAERHFARRASFLITSSPAFVRHYFEAYEQLSLPTLLVENKVLIEAAERAVNPSLSGSAGPLRIGWFGALRCKKSLSALAGLSGRMDGAVEVVLRGKPALTEFDDFHGFVGAQRHMRFAGAYRNPDDLPAIYGEVHFAWAIDFFEEGQNSSWLLPNRIYEGCLNGAIPIALEGTETAAFLRRHGIGVIVPDVSTATLVEAIGRMPPERVAGLARAVAARDPADFAFGTADSVRLVGRIAAFAGRATAGTELVEEAA